MRHPPLAPTALALVVGIGGAVGLLGCGGSASKLPSGWQRGMNFTSYTTAGFATPASSAALQALHATGTNAVAFVPTWYMSSPSSSTIEASPTKTPTDASLLAGMHQAQTLGITLALKPHVDVLDGSFRGAIHPSDPAAWFVSYRAMIDHYAQLAAQGEAKLFVVGDELQSLSERTDDWRSVIAVARSRFNGTLTYGANWVDEAERIGFWGSLDEIGIDGYMPLAPAGHPDPSLGALRAAWAPYQHRLDALHNKTGKAVLFTELGYQSRAETAASPHGNAAGAIDQRAQADAYEAAFQVFSPVSWCRGIYWWEWSADGLNDRTTDDSHRPAGKLAEGVLRSWYGVGM